MVRKLDSRSECPYQIATQPVANRRETRRSASIFENLPVPTAQSLKKCLRVMLRVFMIVNVWSLSSDAADVDIHLIFALIREEVIEPQLFVSAILH